MKLNIVNKSNNAMPAYETINSAGMDLVMESAAILPTGISTMIHLTGLPQNPTKAAGEDLCVHLHMIPRSTTL